MLNYFKTNHILAIIINIIVIISFFVLSFSLDYTNQNNHSILYRAIFGAIENNTTLCIINFVLLLINYIIIIILDNKYNICNSKSSLIAIVYFAISMSYLPIYTSIDQKIASLFFSLALLKGIDAYGKNFTAYNFFDSSFLLGIAIIFSYDATLLIITGLLGLLIFGMLNFREWAISVLGLITPIFFFFGIYYLLKANINDIISDFSKWAITLKDFIPTLKDYISLAIMAFIVVFYSMFTIYNYNKTNNFEKKTYSLLFICFVLSVVGIFIPILGIKTLCYSILPTTFMIANIIQRLKNTWLTEIAFAIFILSAIAIRFFI